MYSGVPTSWPSRVSAVGPAGPGPVALAMPKSMTLGTGTPSQVATRTFGGFRSRWMIPLVWACCTAWQTDTNSSRRPRMPRRAASQCCVMGRPSTYSMTKKGRPSSVVPPSRTLAMFGWSIRASAWRSASSRARTLREPIPARTSFTATRRRTGAVCSASQTVPMPPSPIGSSSR